MHAGRQPAGTLPSFLVIGAARAGTTALCEALAEHPQVFMAEPKEPHYFAFPGRRPRFQGPGDDAMINRRAITDWQVYQRLFASVGDESAAGEGSVSYLYYPQASEEIRRRLPEVRLICLLRNPADRAWSAYQFMRARCYEPLEDFAAALEAEPDRIARNWHHIWHYRAMGRYAEQLQRYFERFDREQIRVFTFEQFQQDPQEVLRQCFEHIGVDPDLKLPVRRSSVVSGEPRSARLSRFLTREHPVKRMVRPLVPDRIRKTVWRRLAHRNLRRTSLGSGVRERLVAHFRPDVLQLQDLLGRDLSAWIT